jgi:lysophospholipase L1-like esterase
MYNLRAVYLDVVTTMDDFSNMIMFDTVKLRLKCFSDLNKVCVKNCIVFAGDSITELYPTDELFLSLENIFIYNRGISGITSTQLLNNINTQIIDLEPNKVFLLIGINDIINEVDINTIANNIATMLDIITKKIVEAKIYVLSVYPLGKVNNNIFNSFSDVEIDIINKTVVGLNERIEKLCSLYKSCIYIDIHKCLINDIVSNDYCVDGIHPTIKTYIKITNILKDYIHD